MTPTTGMILIGAILFLVAIHLTVTYFTSERLTVFTSLCMLSMLPAVAVAMLAAIVTLFVAHDPKLAAIVAAGAFAVLVLPYTGQGLWELVSRRRRTTRSLS
jgi:hypothetical protein